MEFGYGLIIGLFIGANAGIVMAWLLSGAKRDVRSTTNLDSWLHHEQAVMEEAPLQITQRARPILGASPDPFAHP